MNEIPLFPWWLIVGLAVWAAIGPLAGIVIGHYLVRSWQRRQWIADNRKDEYRKILGALNRLNMAFSQQHSTGVADSREIKEAMEEIAIAFNTCLFITYFLEKSKVASNVLDAVRILGEGGSFADYHKEYWKAVNLIMASVKKDALN